MPIHNVLVLGAGKVGKSVAELLLACGGGAYKVTIADRDQKNLDEALANLGQLRAQIASKAKGKHAFGVEFAALKLDVSDTKAVAAQLAKHESVVCMLPFNFVLGIAQAANAAGCHYFDVTEDVRTTDAVRDLAAGKDKAKVALVPQCGLAPGYIAIAAYDVAKQFDKVHTLTLRVGALPQFPTNRLKYNITWSTDGVINEYCEPCNVMLNGGMTKVPALEGLENFSFGGVEYEAFYTSGGVGSLIETLQSDGTLAPHANVAYKTIRYPGHRDLMQFLIQDLRFGEEPAKHRTPGSVDRAMLVDVFNHSVPRTLQDVVVVFINCIGEKHGKLVQVNFQRAVPATMLFGRLWPAIELTTAAGVCAMVDMHRRGKLPRKTGFVKQEEVSLTEFNNSLFGLCYEAPMALEESIVAGTLAPSAAR